MIPVCFPQQIPICTGAVSVCWSVMRAVQAKASTLHSARCSLRFSSPFAAKPHPCLSCSIKPVCLDPADQLDAAACRRSPSWTCFWRLGASSMSSSSCGCCACCLSAFAMTATPASSGVFSIFSSHQAGKSCNCNRNSVLLQLVLCTVRVPTIPLLAMSHDGEHHACEADGDDGHVIHFLRIMQSTS